MSDSVKVTQQTIEKDVSHVFPVPTSSPVVLTIVDRMYSVKDVPEENWTWFAFKGFHKISSELEVKGRQPKTMALVGSGSGLDAIGAAFAFPSLTHLIITDVDESIVKIAVKNIKKNVSRKIKVIGLVGDVCLPLREQRIKADIVYANLPNIPAKDNQIIDHGTFYWKNEPSPIDATIDKYLLGLQQRFLETLRPVLSTNGFALMMIGGRFSYDIFSQLGNQTNCDIREILSAFKLQTEALNVVTGYANSENDKTSFEFYKYDSAINVAKKLQLQNASGELLRSELSAYRISAKEAKAEVRIDRKIGHILHMLQVQPRNA